MIRPTGNLYQYNHKDSSGGHTYVNIATGREGYHGPGYEQKSYSVMFVSSHSTRELKTAAVSKQRQPAP